MYLCDTVGPIPSIDYLHNISNLTTDQLSDVILNYVDYACSDALAYKIAMYCASFSGCLGFISYILMLFSLRKLNVSGCTMIYHKAMVVLELPHMVVMMQYGLTVLNIASIPNSHFWAEWTGRCQWGWMIGDWMKLAVSTLTAFLSLERCFAVCFPAKFELVNQNPVAYSAVVIAIIVGSAHGWALFEMQTVFDPVKNQYVAVNTDFVNTGWDTFISEFILVIKVALCVVIFFLCTLTAVVLHYQAKKITDMSVTAKKEWRARQRVCAFSFIVGMCTFTDHMFWTIHRAALYYTNLGTVSIETEVTMPNTYDHALRDINMARLISATGNTQGFTGQFVHGWRFLIYLALNQSMRDAFKEAMRWGKSKTAPFFTVASETRTQHNSAI